MGPPSAPSARCLGGGSRPSISPPRRPLTALQAPDHGADDCGRRGNRRAEARPRDATIADNRITLALAARRVTLGVTLLLIAALLYAHGASASPRGAEEPAPPAPPSFVSEHAAGRGAPSAPPEPVEAALPALVERQLREAAAAPAIAIVSPEHGSTVRAPFVVVRGTAAPGATVESTGVDLTVAADGQWWFMLALAQGENVALVEATDERGRTSRRTLVVRRPIELVAAPPPPPTAAPPPPAPPATTAAPPRPPAPPASGVATAEARMLALLNGARAEAGLPALVSDPEMVAVARAHSADMTARGYFDHTNPDGQSPFDRMRAAGISFGRAGENIALYPSTDGAHAGLMGSPGHRANILGDRYGRVGVGVHAAGGRLYFTQLFAN